MELARVARRRAARTLRRSSRNSRRNSSRSNALNEISESAYQHSTRIACGCTSWWVKTGSERSRQLLRKLGLEPAPAARSLLAH